MRFFIAKPLGKINRHYHHDKSLCLFQCNTEELPFDCDDDIRLNEYPVAPIYGTYIGRYLHKNDIINIKLREIS